MPSLQGPDQRASNSGLRSAGAGTATRGARVLLVDVPSLLTSVGTHTQTQQQTAPQRGGAGSNRRHIPAAPVTRPEPQQQQQGGTWAVVAAAVQAGRLDLGLAAQELLEQLQQRELELLASGIVMRNGNSASGDAVTVLYVAGGAAPASASPAAPPAGNRPLQPPPRAKKRGGGGGKRAGKDGRPPPLRTPSQAGDEDPTAAPVGLSLAWPARFAITCAGLGCRLPLPPPPGAYFDTLAAAYVFSAERFRPQENSTLKPDSVVVMSDLTRIAQYQDVVLAEMEMAGFGVEVGAMQRLHEESVRRRAQVLDENLEIMAPYDSTGRVVHLVMEHARLDKLIQSYTGLFLQHVDRRTGRVYPTLNQVGTATGRLSMSGANLMALPHDKEEFGEHLRNFRRALVARPGWLLLAADYSQVELRVIAHITQDPTLASAFRERRDVHAQTAARVFRVPLGAVTPAQRQAGKQVNFGLVYGMGAAKLARDIGLPDNEASDFIHTFRDVFATLYDQMDRTKAQAFVSGYATSLRGRRRGFRGAWSGKGLAWLDWQARFEPWRRQQLAAEVLGKLKADEGLAGWRGMDRDDRTTLRELGNMSYQGSTSDIVKAAMVRCTAALGPGPGGINSRAQLLLQVEMELERYPVIDFQFVRAKLTVPLGTILTFRRFMSERVREAANFQAAFPRTLPYIPPPGGGCLNSSAAAVPLAARCLPAAGGMYSSVASYGLSLDATGVRSLRNGYVAQLQNLEWRASYTGGSSSSCHVSSRGGGPGSAVVTLLPVTIGKGSLSQEIQVLARLRHPNIVKLLAANTRPPMVCLVLERMDTSLEKVIHIALQIARALAYLHPTVMHRDLKPANVLISAADSDRPLAKLADFGLARLRDTVLVTQNPEVGTGPYMAPETFDAINFTITDRSDCYSFGVLLWEMVAGTLPWKGFTLVMVAYIVAVLGKRLPMEPLVARGAPHRLIRLVEQCFDTDPQRRPAASDLVKGLLLVQEQLGQEDELQAQTLPPIVNHQ
eukprot:XP_001699573.1 predicted protein [Chlamydomonas reinhardtii]